MNHPPPPPPSPGVPGRPWGYTTPAAAHHVADRAVRAAVHRSLLGEMRTALVLMSRDRPAGVEHARNTLRAAGWSWPALLNHRLGDYAALLASYGHASATAPGRCAPMPPTGRLPSGEWRPAWIGNCAMAVAERCAWAPVALLAEMALLADVPWPTPEQVARAQAIMEATWTEPSGPGRLHLVPLEPWHLDAIAPGLLAIYGDQPGRPGGLMEQVRHLVRRSALVRALLMDGVPEAVVGLSVGHHAAWPWFFATHAAQRSARTLARAARPFLAECHRLRPVLRYEVTPSSPMDRQLAWLGFREVGSVPVAPGQVVVRWERRR